MTTATLTTLSKSYASRSSQITPLSLRLTAIFPGGPGLAGNRMMEMVVTTGAIRRAKLQSNHHHQQTNTQFFTGQTTFLSPDRQCKRAEGKSKHLDHKII